MSLVFRSSEPTKRFCCRKWRRMFIHRPPEIDVHDYIEVVGHSLTPSCIITVTGDKLKQVNQFTYLGSLISQDGGCNQTDQTSNWNIKEHFPQHEDGTNITSNKYVYETAFTEVLRVVHSIVPYGCESWTVSQRMKSQLEATEMWFYGVCCILHGLTKCQAKKYFKEPIHQQIVWRLSLTGKSDLWDISWERVS